MDAIRWNGKNSHVITIVRGPVLFWSFGIALPGCYLIFYSMQLKMVVARPKHVVAILLDSKFITRLLFIVVMQNNWSPASLYTNMKEKEPERELMFD